jgi:hypothetical protein
MAKWGDSDDAQGVGISSSHDTEAAPLIQAHQPVKLRDGGQAASHAAAVIAAVPAWRRPLLAAWNK